MTGTVALTGVTGFIGSVLARRLSAEGWCVRALVRPASSKARNDSLAAEWIDGTLEDSESLCQLITGVDIVVHCAGLVQAPSKADFLRVNVDGVARLAQVAAKQKPLPRFLLISSVAAREPDISPYASSKRQGEMALVSGAAGMGWTILRPPAVYGLGNRVLDGLFGWMGRGVALILGPPNMRFSLLHVEDLADAVLRCLKGGVFAGQTFELHDGHPNGYTWGEVANTVAQVRERRVLHARVPVPVLDLLAKANTLLSRVFRYAPMLTPGKVRELQHPNWVCDNDEFYRATGWVPQLSLEEGLRRTLGLGPAIAGSALAQG